MSKVDTRQPLRIHSVPVGAFKILFCLLKPKTLNPTTAGHRRSSSGHLPRIPTWRFAGTYNPKSESTYNLLRGLRGRRGLMCAILIGVISTPEPRSRSEKVLELSGFRVRVWGLRVQG